jgi:hypothetical protein
MARERETKELILVKPTEFEFQRNGQDAKGWEFTSIDGEQFNTFDPGLVKAFNDKDLKGEKQEYIVLLPDPERSNQKPSIIEIVGVYKSQGGGGWRGGGGGMTDRQVAGMMAATAFYNSEAETAEEWVEVLEPVVDAFEALLKKGQASQGNGSSGSDTQETAEEKPERVEVEGVSDLEELAAAAFPDREKLAKNYLKTAPKRYGKKTLEDLTTDEMAEIATELTGLIPKNEDK